MNTFDALLVFISQLKGQFCLKNGLKVDNKKIGFRKNLPFLNRFRTIHSNKKNCEKIFLRVLCQRKCVSVAGSSSQMLLFALIIEFNGMLFMQ